MVDLKPYKSQIDAARQAQSHSDYSDPREGFRAELTAAGFTPPKTIDIGRLTRINAPGDKGKKQSGWCVYQEFDDQGHDGRAFGVGVYGSWKGNPDKVTWSSKAVQAMSTAERINYNAQIEAARDIREAELKQLQDEAAERAYTIWNNAAPAEDSNPYLARKGVKAYDGVRQLKDRLVVPVIVDGRLTSLQFIKNDGNFDYIETNKKFLRNGRKKGCYFVIQGIHEKIFIAEGYATGASLHVATGATVYVAFDSGNLYEVASAAKQKHPEAKITIAADDDRFTNGNPGKTRAAQVADGLGLAFVLPVFKNPECEDLTDFNDMAREQGIEAVQALFSYKPALYEAPKSNVVQSIMAPPGILGEIMNYYNATAGNNQPLFAVQTAIAICSVLCARNFTTNFNNRSSLFLINIAKSGTGKEHGKKTMERILEACNMGRLVSGDGYTAGSAVISALQDRPRHITVIDEFSKYLQAAQNKYGSSHLMEANVQLMQAIGRLDGVMRPRAYSTLNAPKEKKKEISDMKIINPAITLLAMSTPDDLFSRLDLSSIKDGFLNRFIICISDAERSVRQHKEPIDVPQVIIDWAEAIEQRRGNQGEHAADEPKLSLLSFSTDANNLHHEFDQFCIDQANKLENMGMSEISGRSNEMAMRLALLVALARDPKAETISADDSNWAIEWVKHHLTTLIEKLKMSISSSAHEGDKKEILKAIRDSKTGVTWTDMQKRQPFAKHKAKDLKEILSALVDADLILSDQHQNGGKGRPTLIYKATA